ncbi:MAG: hypothetical protein RDU59_06410 [Thermodesulfobacteriota bacterium]|nr:hypothetical protein [Desulfovibrionales bacterium]MDQ7838107.1 hypothetical protein [Thermodesulfobacteriota bacterium]
MLVKNPKTFNLGLMLMISFFIVFYVIMFVPLVDNKTVIIYADDMFNSLAKGSTNFIPKYMEKSEKFVGKPLEMSFKMKAAGEAEKAAILFGKNGSTVTVAGEKVTLTGGDYGKTMLAAENDADFMFNNRGDEVAAKYGFNEKEVMYIWHTAFTKLIKELEKQERFEGSIFLGDVLTKVIEPGYNFYGIKPEKVKDHVVLLVALLVFYVIYTLWFGYSIYELFNGMGLTMTKSKAKKE